MTLWVTDDEFSDFMQVSRDDDPPDEEWLSVANAAAHAGIRLALARDLDLVDPDNLPAATDRRFHPTGIGPILRIDDCVTVTTVDGVAFDDTAYQLEPLNNRSTSGEWRPYTTIRSGRHRSWRGDNTFGTITIGAVWGWTVIPAGAYTGVRLLGKEIADGKEIRFGLAALTDYAGIRARENPAVWAQIKGIARAESILIA